MFKKTFFVLSPSYHGATLLAKLINAHPDVTALGDTYPSNRFDQVCGCGKHVSRCDFWQYIKTETAAERYLSNRSMLPHYPGDHGGRLARLLYSDFTSFWATSSNLRRLHGSGTLARFRQEYDAFLTAVHEKTVDAGNVFVDGLKFNSRVAALQAATFPIDGVIHLYRNPADFVGSALRNTDQTGLSGASKHALRYRLYHARARQVCKSLPSINLTYEGLADDINQELARLFDFLGVVPMKVAELRKYFDREWHFMGNASLFHFDGVIRASHHQMPRGRRIWSKLLAGSR